MNLNNLINLFNYWCPNYKLLFNWLKQWMLGLMNYHHIKLFLHHLFMYLKNGKCYFYFKVVLYFEIHITFSQKFINPTFFIC